MDTMQFQVYRRLVQILEGRCTNVRRLNDDGEPCQRRKRVGIAHNVAHNDLLHGFLPQQQPISLRLFSCSIESIKRGVCTVQHFKSKTK